MAIASSERVLVVDDDQAVAKVLAALLAQAGIGAEVIDSADKALTLLERRPYDAVVTDVRMPGMDGLELLTRISERWPEVPVIVITAHGTVPLAVEAMKKGAADFVQKPFDREEILFVVRKALEQGKSAAVSSPASDGGLFGTSAPMRDAQALLKRAAAGTATVLLRGESGTGKEVAARSLHLQSPRKAGPFVKLHCAALPETLLESELFGYEKGAFTGAANRKPGRVELAQGGTLFLDEIGDITAAIQVKLLRVLQEREFERLGGTVTLKADVRFVAATHRNLEEMVKEGLFREDLFYRLNVVPVFLPPLRSRPEDIAPLAEHFCAQLGVANGRPDAKLSPDALERLKTQGWPGNVRQLQNFIERLVVLSENSVFTAANVDRELGRSSGVAPSPATAAPNDGTLDSSRKQAERDALLGALSRAKDNRTLAARLLGVSRRTLYNKLEEHGLA